MAALAPDSPTPAKAWPDLPIYGSDLGGDLPPEVACHMRAAAEAYHDEPVAERHLLAALELAPENMAVHIGLYRFYFYKNRLTDALACAERCLSDAARRIGLPADWARVKPAHGAFESWNAEPRFYLFTLKAYAYIRMRLGDLEEGRRAVAKVRELDPHDRLGASVLEGVLNRVGEEDDE